ncbi:MAG TPA: hypothetical protein VJM15_10615 [Sphingomicrobium sp.]|nr:hypothetical protein [Sphingomicrobium sp.]
MRAVSRLKLAMLAAGLMLAASPTLAQNAQESASGTPAAEAIGPRELQNFSLDGTVTRQADAPPVGAPAQSRTTPAPPPPQGAAGATPRATPRTAAVRETPSPASQPSRRGEALALELPPTPAGASPLPAAAPQPGFAVDVAPASAPLRPPPGPTWWPWLLLAVLGGATAAFLLRRRRSHEAFAGGPSVDAFAGPEPAAVPRPAPAPAPPPPPKAPTAKPSGIVSTRLRPWIEIGFAPIGCSVDDDRVLIDFEVELFNSGAGPARDILVEASMFNAGPTQDRDIGAFFAKPVGEGERIQVLPPLQRITFRSALVAPRTNIQQFELAGRKLFVPLVAFNAIYRWSGGDGQTSSGYLLGREGKSDKLGPLRLDLGPRAFTNLASRLLPNGVRK